MADRFSVHKRGSNRVQAQFETEHEARAYVASKPYRCRPLYIGDNVAENEKRLLPSGGELATVLMAVAHCGEEGLR
jgi:hypothetical protein